MAKEQKASKRELELAEEMAQLGHALQSGVKAEMDKRHEPTSPKHLRTGVNTALVYHGALVKLLVDKGIFTREEYGEAAVAAMREEVERYEKRLSELYGTNITLG